MGYGMQKPVALGDELDVYIEAIAAKGDGIAKVEGFVVFVRGAELNKKVRVRIAKMFEKFAVGELVG